MAGLRGEYADIRNNLYSLDSITRQHYTNIYPTLHASRKLNEHNGLQLSYSLRVNLSLIHIYFRTGINQCSSKDSE